MRKHGFNIIPVVLENKLLINDHNAIVFVEIIVDVEAIEDDIIPAVLRTSC